MIVDASFGYAKVTPQALDSIGADGVIFYAGCNDSSKNVSKTVFEANATAGKKIGLVIENGNTDMRGGYDIGAQYGANLANGAKTLGYDITQYVGFTAADFDVTSRADLLAVDAFMQGFGKEIPVPGLYGDKEVIDYCAMLEHGKVFWQTDAMAWSGGVTSEHAHIQQRYNDPRAKGLPVDIDDVLGNPLYMMGENMSVQLDPNDPVIVAIQKRMDTLAQVIIWGDSNHPYSLESLSKAVAQLVSSGSVAQFDVAAFAQQVAAHLKGTTTITGD